MLHLRLSANPEHASEVRAALDQVGGLHRLATTTAADGGTIFEADVELSSTDTLVERLEALGEMSEDYVLYQLEVIAPASARRAHGDGVTDFAWVEVLGQARANSRLFARYFALMAVAGVIAGLGVITDNAILIVGAMAVSPDLLPLCSLCVGIVSGRHRVVRRASVTLASGLILAGVMATLVTVLLDAANILPADFEVGSSGLGTLATTDYSTVLVALAAGVAAMLSFETRASAAVGVAISVTTIPASAYWGVAVGASEEGGAGGALLVLAVNVTLLVLSGSATLAAQRRLRARDHANRA